jgi:guanylate kinase
MKARKSNVFIISAPSGAGKSTLIQHLLFRVPSLFFSISHTTRPPRSGEKNGVDYFFVDEPVFQKMIAAKQFLEWAQVHGYLYGTSREMLKVAAELGKDLVLDVDVQGASQVKKSIPEAITIFIMPPNFDSLQERLIRRQKDTPKQIMQRMENARKEIQAYKEYQFIVINENVESALEDLLGIVRSQHCKREVLDEKIGKIMKSFGFRV